MHNIPSSIAFDHLSAFLLRSLPRGLYSLKEVLCFHSWYRWSFDPIHPNLSSSKCSIAKQFVREEWYMDRVIVGEGQSDAVAEPPRPFSLLKTLTEFRVSCRVFYVGCVAREGHLLWFIRIPSSGLCSAAIFARFGSGYWSQCFACIVRCLYR